ncbi:DMT family transporter [Marinomonas spartinae]|uniref:DMT family transporter n=1 Tax=Marinomonas spartinae TaxID=1792290 RepID=UPI0018F264E6|nr:DMT family transporter [Marinomonas spartinae]MBJ7554988.1 DMT family transporter [Marinomonas spartinae]
MVIKTPQTALVTLIFVTFVWGSEFTLIDLAMKVIPVNTFNAVRFTLAGLSLIPLLLLSKEKVLKAQIRPLLGKGATLGFVLFIAFYTQTEGLKYTSVSNAGFITSLATPLVPILGFLLFKTRANRFVWLGIVLATIGLYLLTVGDKLAFNKGDYIVLICAFAFAVHMLLTGRFVVSLPVIPLTIIQLFAVGVYSAISAFVSPNPAFYLAGNPPLSWQECIFSPIVLTTILIASLLGTAYAYWAQSACQKLLPDYKVALVFTLEPIFAYLTAWLILSEKLGLSGAIGALSILAGVILAETGDKFLLRKRTTHVASPHSSK